jgi:hypothetical protein
MENVGMEYGIFNFLTIKCWRKNGNDDSREEEGI